MKKLLLIPLLFLAGCGTQPIQEPPLGATVPIVVEEKIEVVTKPQEIIPAVTEQLTKKEVKVRIDNAQIEIEMLNQRIDNLLLQKDKIKSQLAQDKLLLTQFK